MSLITLLEVLSEHGNYSFAKEKKHSELKAWSFPDANGWMIVIIVDRTSFSEECFRVWSLASCES